MFLADESLEARRDAKEHWLLRTVPSSAVVTLVARQGRALQEWLRQRAAAEGITVSGDAAQLLVEWVGDDTAALLGEVRKAALAGASRQVGRREVEAVVGEHRVAGVFELTDAIQRRDVGLALRTLERLLATEEPLRLLALLTSEVRLAWTVHDLSKRGQSAEQIARTVRRPPRVIAAHLAAVSEGSPATLFARLTHCWAVERRIKSSGQPGAELGALVAVLAAAER
jgi:DNA polymerase III subunit delta